MRQLDGASDSGDIQLLVEIGEQFTSESTLEEAVEHEMSLPAIGTVLEEMQRRIFAAKSQSVESERGKFEPALFGLDTLDSDLMAYVEECRAGEDRPELSIMGSVVSMLHDSVGHLPDPEMQRSLWMQMEPLQAAFQPELSMDGMPDAAAVVTLLKDNQPSMAKIIEDLDTTASSGSVDGCPPLEWTRFSLAIQALRDFTDMYSKVEDREDIVFQLTNPPIVLEVLSQFLHGSFDWS